MTAGTDIEPDVGAADGLGTGRGRVLAGLRHSVPGLVGGALLLVVVLAAVGAPRLAPYPTDEVHFTTPFQVPHTFGETLLSFLGLGIQPPAPSLGIMLSDAQEYLFRAPYAALFPGLAILVICLAFNLFGGALRDALQPGARR
jgi:ABC-type antimicrobial peptide transport system permease subunit